MTTEQVVEDDDRKSARFDFDRHTPEYRHKFLEITHELHANSPIAWSETYGGHFVASGNKEVFELARSADYLSNDHDTTGDGTGYLGITIPSPPAGSGMRGGFLEMDPPEQRHYRQALNPYLSPAAIKRWIPLIDDLVQACIDEKIESGHIDFVEDLANVVPAVLTLAMLGIPVERWEIYNEPAHASVYTPPEEQNTPEFEQMRMAMGMDLYNSLQAVKADPKPGLIKAVLDADINGTKPDDMELLGVLALLIGGGFDTTTALTAHALEWLSENPAERQRLSDERDSLLDSATEEFLRFYTPAPGDARTISQDCEIAGQQFKEGDRLWLSWAMANRDPAVFEDPNTIHLDRKGNRHSSFGLGIHRCIGSNVARTVFKRMLLQVLDRMPDFVCDAEGARHYDTIGVIQGMRNLPATFTPGKPVGPGLAATLEKFQRVSDEQRLAEPVTRGKE